MPTSGSSLYKYEQNSWRQVYKELLLKKDKEKIRQALESVIFDTNIVQPEHIYGELIKDKETQITYSALGQKAPIELKKKWDLNHSKRDKIIRKHVARKQVINDYIFSIKDE